MGGNKKISPKNYIKCVKNAFFVENIQKSFNNCERLPLLMADTLCPLPFNYTPSAEAINV